MNFWKKDTQTQRQKLQAKAKRLYAQGVSTAQIAERLGFTTRTIRRWISGGENNVD